MTKAINVVSLHAPICVDCKWREENSSFPMPIYTPPMCTNVRNGRLDVVHGQMFRILYTARDAGSVCGPAGKLFEPRPPGLWQRAKQLVFG